MWLSLPFEHRSASLALGVAMLACAGGAAASPSGTAWQTPVRGCMNSWVSNGTWSVRVTGIKNQPDRLDVSLTWRNDTKKTLEPRGSTVAGVHGLSITYAGPYGYNGSDSLGIWDTADSDHPERKQLGYDLLTHSFAPEATFQTVLRFYYPATYSASTGHSIVAPQKHKPIEFMVDTVIAPAQHCTKGCQSPIVVRLNCPA
jgi:hypothetical protein